MIEVCHHILSNTNLSGFPVSKKDKTRARKEEQKTY